MYRCTLNSGPHMTNARRVIIQQQVCLRWEPGEAPESGPLWEQISLVPPSEKASANRFKIRPGAFNLGRGAGAAGAPTRRRDWAQGTRWDDREKGVGPPHHKIIAPQGQRGEEREVAVLPCIPHKTQTEISHTDPSDCADHRSDGRTRVSLKPPSTLIDHTGSVCPRSGLRGVHKGLINLISGQNITLGSNIRRTFCSRLASFCCSFPFLFSCFKACYCVRQFLSVNHCSCFGGFTYSNNSFVYFLDTLFLFLTLVLHGCS